MPRGGRRSNHTCPGCGKQCLGAVCSLCTSKNRGRFYCVICGERHPKPLDHAEWCMACSLISDRIAANNGRSVANIFPPGHLERLAERAAQGLPLFEKRREERCT